MMEGVGDYQNKWKRAPYSDAEEIGVLIPSDDAADTRTIADPCYEIVSRESFQTVEVGQCAVAAVRTGHFT
jgi:hypothetical protein